MLYSWVREYVKKYTFIDDVSFTKGIFYMYYTNKEGKKQVAKLPFRATKAQLEQKIARIKEDVDFKSIKAVRDEKVKEAVKYNEVAITFV
jgi:DNA gyrase/topoisomerase IV subunit A